MLLVSYDFTDDKTRARFAKFLKKFGRKMQYSVYEIKNSPRVLRKILNEIELTYAKYFKSTDSILIFQNCKHCDQKIIRYGSAKHEESDVVVFK